MLEQHSMQHLQLVLVRNSQLGGTLRLSIVVAVHSPARLVS
jgi:hypothetical protein